MNDQIRSLGYRTDFIFNEFDGSIEPKSNYTVVKTNSNPNYFWGNLLLYKKPPNKEDFIKWKSDFRKEFQDPRIFHITLAWDSPEGHEGEVGDFIREGFELESSVVLTANKVILPRKYNDNVQLKIIKNAEDFEACINVQTSCASDKLSKESWESFYRASMGQYRKMIEKKKGLWFGATLDGRIVGSLGIFADGDVGRFQIVSTHPEFQRRGVCSTLVYKSAKYALKELGIKTLVMVAGEDYHAAKIYESIGFVPTEKQIGLCWWDKDKHK